MNKPYHKTDHGVLYCGGCLEVLREMADESVDSIVTDPPYGLSFMGKKWDYDVPSVEVWRECLRVLKPGGHLLSFAGTRTQHRMAVRIEDAGFEIRDMLAWIYGSGFPKSLDVGKAIDKMQGTKRTETVWKDRYHDGGTRSTQEKGSAAISFGCDANGNYTTLPATPEAKHWDGFGTALKPALESITMAQKPLDSSSTLNIMASELIHKIREAICQSRLLAPTAESNSMSSPQDTKEAANTALCSAGNSTNTRDALCDLMAMLQSGLEQTSSLSIVLSWLNTLVGICEEMSIFTTRTELSPIIELKILNSMEWESIFQSITQASNKQTSELTASVWYAESIFSVLRLRLETIQEHSAQDSATLSGGIKGLRPNLSPIILSRKPISEKTVAANVLMHGTGGINIDGCRVEYVNDMLPPKIERSPKTDSIYGKFADNNGEVSWEGNTQGRFPANLIHDGSDEVLAVFPNTKSGSLNAGHKRGETEFYGGGIIQKDYGNDSGSAARFFANFPLDKICPLCNVSLYKDNNKEVNEWKELLALSAEKSGWNTQATTEFIARLSAMLNQSEQKDPSARYAETLCKRCETLIALALAGIRNSAFSKEELQVILDCIGNFSECSLTQSLAFFAEMQDNTDTTQIMTSLLKLSGYVNPAITNCTPETKRLELKRFIYSPKASKAERNMGLDGIKPVRESDRVRDDGVGGDNPRNRSNTAKQNHHPTVKPIAVMQWLCRLVTPPNGTVLDPFLGSGTTAMAAIREGFRYIGIEREQEYCEIAARRIESELDQTTINLEASK